MKEVSKADDDMEKFYKRFDEEKKNKKQSDRYQS